MSAERKQMAVLSKEIYRTCIRCGLCLYTCPTYRHLLMETASPRGRVALIRAAAEGEISLNGHYPDYFYNCLLCSACDAVCPSGTKLNRLFSEIREEIASLHLVPPPLQRLSQAILSCRNIAGEDNCRRLVWTENMERKPLGIQLQERVSTVYFVGCVSSFFPASYGIAQVFTQTLEMAGVDYALLGGEECCCGYPLLIIGQSQESEALIRYNIERVRARGASRVVVTCPSCYHAWRHIYPEVAGEEMKGIEVLHATELLEKLIESGALPLGEFPYKVTYHDPCDLGRKSGVYIPPRKVLRSIPGLKLIEMADSYENALCCGGGGNVETFDPGLVQALAGRRLAQVKASGADIVISACPQCKRTFQGAARRERLRLRAMDITEVVWEALNAR
ncbi:MAG: (Fe-S)-binding protein [Anaerolineae bacterium]